MRCRASLALAVSLVVLGGWSLASAERQASVQVFALAAQGPLAGCQSGLFADPASPGRLSPPRHPTIRRARLVEIHFGLLPTAGSPSGRGSLLELNLFPDTCLTAVLDHTEASPLNKATWIGRIQGVTPSQIILVAADGVMAASITLPGKLYQVRYIADGVHAVVEINQQAFAPD